MSVNIDRFAGTGLDEITLERVKQSPKVVINGGHKVRLLCTHGSSGIYILARERGDSTYEIMMTPIAGTVITYEALVE